MAHRRHWTISLGTAALLFLHGADVPALVGDSDEAFGLDGSLRTITAATVNYDFPLLFGEDNPGDGISSTLLRLTAGGNPADWLTYELHAVQSLTFTTLQMEGVQGPGLFGMNFGIFIFRIPDFRKVRHNEADAQPCRNQVI